ncbi:hypothetical protein ACFP3Q_00155 [Nocardioides sp. GCM10027113]|uniref:hypothetical protein n=1 Tax=unclassified Nocardioides TaxID=2615069 RepID=UPI003606E28D
MAVAARAISTTVVLCVLSALLVSSTAAVASGPTPTSTTWTYDQAAHQLVGPPGTEPFAIKNGTAVGDGYGEWAVRFTTAPGLAYFTGSGFPAPGADDFAWTVDLAVDWIRAKSTANVAQAGLYSEQQIKLQLTRTGVPQCVLNGTGGRVFVTSAGASLADGGLRHTVSCWRSGGTVGITVDCVSTTSTFALGSIAPTTAPTVGNRSLTGKAGDQLYGRVWRLTVDTGPGAGPPC